MCGSILVLTVMAPANREFIIRATRYKKGLLIEAQYTVFAKNKRAAKRAFKEDYPKFEIVEVKKKEV